MINIKLQSTKMQVYSSIQEIKNKFNIKEDNIEDIKKSLTLLRAKNHPDLNGGTVKEIYYEAYSALEYINNCGKNDAANQLVPIVTEMTSLIKSVIESSEIAKRNQDKEYNTYNRMNDYMREYHSKFYIPAFGSSTLFLIMSAILVFPKTITENPTLKVFFDPTNSLFFLTWILLLSVTTALWLLKVKQERYLKKKISFLKSERGRFDLFQKFIINLHHFNGINNYFDNDLVDKEEIKTEEKNIFRKTDFISMLESFLRGKQDYDFFSIIIMDQVIDNEIIENIADITLAKAIDKNIIHLIDNLNFIDIYEINDNYLKSTNKI